MKKHVDAKRNLFAKKIDKEMNNLMRTQVERQPFKNRPNVSSYEISKFFSTKLPYKKDEVQHKQFLKDLVLLIAKSHFLVHFLESPWLK